MTHHEDDPIRWLAQADLLLLVGELSSPPSAASVRSLSIDDAEMTALIEHAGADASSQITSSLRHALAHAAAVDLNDWSAEHSRLFDGAIFCPINETAFVRRDKGTIIADLCGFYNAFNFEPVTDTGEKADHLICELEFAARLLVLLADAHHRGNDDQLDDTRDALRAFVTDHLGEWSASFAERLRHATQLELYLHVAEALDAVMKLVCADLGLPDPSEAPISDPRAEPGSPYECDMAIEDQPDGPPIMQPTVGRT